MTPEEQKMLREIHDFWMAQRGPKLPSRAEEIDQALDAVRAGKLGARATLWLAGFVAAVVTLWHQLGGKG